GRAPGHAPAATTMATRSMPTVSWRSRAWATSSLVPTPSLAAARTGSAGTPARPRSPERPGGPTGAAARRPAPARAPRERHRPLAGLDVDPGLGVGERLPVHRRLGGQALEQLLALDLGLHRDRVVPREARGAQAPLPGAGRGLGQ